MSCSNPNFVVETPYLKDDGTPVTLFFNQKPNFDNMEGYRVIEVPCGCCEQCLSQRAQEWSAKCIAELQLHKESCVINLTYNDDYLPSCIKVKRKESSESYVFSKSQDFIDKKTGYVIYFNGIVDDSFDVVSEKPSFDYSDVQKFFKRLRKKIGAFRYYGCCEYGEHYKRPHYHIIVYGFKPSDLVYWKTTKAGSIQYRSLFIEKLWNKGFVTIGEASASSIFYISGYVLKKYLGSQNKGYYLNKGLLPERNFFSQNLGGEFFSENSTQIYDLGKVYIGTGDGNAVAVYKNKTLDRKIALEDPQFIRSIKNMRSSVMEAREYTRAFKSGVPVEELRKILAREFHERIIKSKRRAFD